MVARHAFATDRAYSPAEFAKEAIDV